MSNQIYSKTNLLYDLPWGQRPSDAGNLGTNYQYHINDTADSANLSDQTASITTLGGMSVAKTINANVINTQTLSNLGGLRCSAYQTASGTQTVANVTPTAVTFDAEIYDVGSIHSTVTNNTRFTNTTLITRRMLVTYSAGYNNPFVGQRMFYILLNGQTTRKFGWTNYDNTGNATNEAANFSGSAMIEMLPNDYIELYTYQTSGASKTLGNAATSDYVSIQLTEVY